MFLRLAALVFLFVSFGQAAWSQNAPDIALRSDTELGAFNSSGLIIENLSLTADVQAGLAQVSLFAVLRNETDEDVEASFAYPLPSNAVINGYALDIDGKLVDGVLLPKERAEKLYTDRVTQSIDPGIAARTIDNRYKTRIYPIAAEGGRRSIQLDFTVPVPADGLHLPFSFDALIESVSLHIQGDGAEDVKRPLEKTTTLNTTIKGDIFIPAAAATGTLSQYNGTSILTVLLASNTKPKISPVTSAAIIWDSSLSRTTSNLDKERRFIRDVMSQLTLEKQSLVIGASSIDLAQSYDRPEDLISAVDNIRYDGATNLSALLDIETLTQSHIQADICLVISDGTSSFGPGGLPNLPCRVFTYSASKIPNVDWLSLLAGRNAGTNLSGQSVADAIKQITSQGEFQLAPHQPGEVFHFGNRSWFIAPVKDNQRQFQIKFQDQVKDVNLGTLPKTSHPAAAAIWGQRRIETLRAEGPSRFDDIVAASRHWSVQTKETSFLVLESADEYVNAELSPPRNFPTDRLEDYKTSLAKYREEEFQKREDHLEDIAPHWKEQVEWWETDWSTEEQYDARPTPLIMPAPPAISSNNLGTIPVEPIPEPEPSSVLESLPDDCADCDYIVASGARQSSPAGNLPAEITLSLRPWSPERPFLTALDGLKGEAFELEYIQQRKTHGDRPSFYLEIADQLHRTGRQERAAKMALSALDLQSLKTVTRSNVADRLLMYGRTDIAIEIYRDVLPTATDRPQPFYNLALALIQAGDTAKRKDRTNFYSEAFTHLLHVISAPWEEDYEGIHLIALQDLNRTLAHLPRRQRRKFQKDLGLDDEFYRNLHTDIRVLVDWTAADADLDIRVIEDVESEDEETADYGNDQTQRGGRISNDMTDGYGPEEYLIRKAPKGLYRIETDYYAQDDYAEDGALNLRARIWRNFGRKNESSETIIIEMLEEKEDAYVLGEINVTDKN